ncbi:MAG: hypothetical protein V2I97_17260 [Desulfococcaceae bacterium]|jgi:hypothetical protein|nr:hypothetical protein [Desulfococcaceae bacterium]
MYAVLSGNAVTGNLLSNGIKKEYTIPIEVFPGMKFAPDVNRNCPADS